MAFSTTSTVVATLSGLARPGSMPSHHSLIVGLVMTVSALTATPPTASATWLAVCGAWCFSWEALYVRSLRGIDDLNGLPCRCGIGC